MPTGWLQTGQAYNPVGIWRAMDVRRVIVHALHLIAHLCLIDNRIMQQNAK